MIPMIIAHRGLLDGPDSVLQNHPAQITKAIREGFQVEIDVWYIDGKWMLGHDGPEHLVDWSFFIEYGDSMWIHCKHLPSFFQFKSDTSHQLNYFFHDTDLVIFTSKNYVWTYFGRPDMMHPSSICVMPEVNYTWQEIKDFATPANWAGICTDWPRKLRECLK